MKYVWDFFIEISCIYWEVVHLFQIASVSTKKKCFFRKDGAFILLDTDRVFRQILSITR